MAEARVEDSGSGLAPASEGWFVVNVRDAEWWTSGWSGSRCFFENEYPASVDAPKVEFSQFGINITVLEPGQPNGLYHGEDGQEDFLVLLGECLLLVEGEQQRLRAWDFVHCAPQTEHIFVGAGDGPCVILMAGARTEDDRGHYPVSELAARYGASVKEETSDPDQAYAGFEWSRRERPSYWDRLPWA